MNRNILDIIEEFNNKNKIEDVIETVAGAHIHKKSLCCPLHGGDSPTGASIHTGNNIFTCWTGNCGKGITPWQFVKKYYKLNGFKEVAQKVNQLFKANIPIWDKEQKEEKQSREVFNCVYNVKKYLSEAQEVLVGELRNNKHILLNANTGLGKTYGITQLFSRNIFADDYIFFLVPTRAIAEQVAEEYPIFQLFYKDDSLLPVGKFVVSTYHKIHLLEKAIESEIRTRAILGDFPPMYTVVVDECHELMTKRKLLGNKARKVETFIKNSDRSIMMSANTKYMNAAYKDKGLFNKYICVERTETLYNADILNVHRLPKGTASKTLTVVNLIKDKLANCDKVLFYEDSKELLQEYSHILNKVGIDNVVITSDNKEEDDVIEDYSTIIKDSKLIKKVTLTTSLINAGVNIIDENIALIVKQDRNKVDMLKIEQFLARVRTTGNDLTVLLGSTDKEIKKTVDFKKFLYKVEQEAKVISLGFNVDVAEGYGLDINAESFATLWKTYKSNEAYVSVKELAYVEGSILKIDETAVHEKARNDFERANYYSDEFIIEQLQNVKVKEIKVSTIAPVTVKKDKKSKKDSNFNTAVNELINEAEALTELYNLATKKIKSANIQNKKMKEFYNEFNRNKLYKEMLRNLRDCILPHMENKNISKTRIFTDIVNVYSKDVKKKQRGFAIDNIKRLEILNKLMPVGTDYAKVKVTGDYVYMAVRKNLDCYISNRKTIKDRALDWVLNDLMNLRDLEVLDNKYYVNKGEKKFKINDVVAEIKNCIEGIYNVTDKGYITGLL